MKKLCIVLCVVLCLSLLGGCSVDITVHDESGNSIAVPDGIESMVGDVLEQMSSTTTAQTPATAQTTTSTTAAPIVGSTTTKPSETTKAPSKSTSTSTPAPAAPKPNTAKYITGIAIHTMPAKTNYITGEKLDPAGLVLSRLYSDGSSDTTTNNFEVKGFNSKTPGKKTLTVVYKHENGSTLLCNYDIKVEKKQHGTPNYPKNFHHDMENEVLKLVNEARRNAGLGELKMDNSNMMNAADIRAMEIVNNWAHERPDHDKWDTVFDEEGVDYNARGENLGKNAIPKDGSSAVQNIFDTWMNSKDHRENIMQPTFTHVSIACLEHNGIYYWVQLFGANVKR